MGIILTDYVVESVIRDGLKDLRDRPALIDDLFSTLLDPHLVVDYGEQVLNQIKEYVIGNKIYVVQSYNLTGAKFPCYSINLDQCVESDKEAFFQDYGSSSTTPITPAIVVNAFAANSYDPVTGVVSVPDIVDLSTVTPLNFLVDGIGTNYQIVGGVSNVTGSKQFNIGKGLGTPPDLSGTVEIWSSVSVQIQETGIVPFRERLMIGVYAQNDPNVCKWMYYLLMYFLHQRKASLEARDVQLSSITASDFSRMEDLPEHIYARYVSLNCLTYFEWNAALTDIVAYAGLNIRVPKDVLVVNDPTRTINTEL